MSQFNISVDNKPDWWWSPQTDTTFIICLLARDREPTCRLFYDNLGGLMIFGGSQQQKEEAFLRLLKVAK